MAQVRVATERDGPVVLGPDRAVLVEKTYEEASGVPPAGWKRTLTRLRFLTPASRLLYQETLESRLIAEQGFDGETSAGPAQELRGSARRFLSQTRTGEFTTWLRVRIDGEEGWVSGEGQDLDRLGLPTAG